jgi:hypothetical protein
VPILRDHDPRIGCLAVPLSTVAGFVVVVLAAAAAGVGASDATAAGVVGAVAGLAGGLTIVRRTDPLRRRAEGPPT